jgi:site-specific recombinase XerD
MKRQQSNADIVSLYKQFQTHNKVKNLSEKTIDYYYWNIKPFVSYLFSQSIHYIKEINSSVIDTYIFFILKRIMPMQQVLIHI